MTGDHRRQRSGRAVLLLAKSAFTASPIQEMERLAARVAAFDGVTETGFAFTEQGEPSLRETLEALCAKPFAEILILPLFLPMEPSLLAWLNRSLSRWQLEATEPWPQLRIARQVSESDAFDRLLEALTQSIADQTELVPAARKAAEGSLVPPQKRRVLVCQGGPCNAAGASAIWGHLRNEQKRQNLRTTGDGTMTAKTTCLGPCNLAPVMQVFPEGTYYGGVTERAVDRIISEHLLEGRIVADLAYEANSRKQFLRG